MRIFPHRWHNRNSRFSYTTYPAPDEVFFCLNFVFFLFFLPLIKMLIFRLLNGFLFKNWLFFCLKIVFFATKKKKKSRAISQLDGSIEGVNMRTSMFIMSVQR